MTDDIVAFIRARLQDEQDRSWAVHDVSKCDALLYAEDLADAARREPVCDCGMPARVLRGVEAKRRIVDKVSNWQHQRLYDSLDENVGPYSCSRDGHTCECGVLDQQLDVLSPSASEWSTHEAFRTEWSL